jgi:uncharacterized protein YmfQ (DUF2313 family)
MDPGRTSSGVYQLAPSPLPWPDRPAQADALADPAPALMAEHLYGLLPTGSAWRSPDGAAFDANSRLGGLMRALAGDLVTLYRRIFQAGQESTAATLVDGMDDWEAEYGLPDPCFGENQSRSQRLRALLLKVRSTGTITRADFARLAASVGYTITIEEPLPFEFGRSWCGGEEGTDGAADYHWIVRVPGRAHAYFEFGVSEFGIHPMLDIAFATDLECLFRALAPAWTRVVFDYS